MTNHGDTTRVLFPRFEFETPQEGDILKRELISIAEPRRWMIDSDVERLRHPKTDTNAGYTDKSHNREEWWGLQHNARAAMTLGLLATDEPDSVPFASDPNSLYRYQVFRHSYRWDSQSLHGRRDELVLERLTLKGFREVLALMFNPSKSAEQQLVRADEAGRWYEPEYTNITRDPERRFYLGIMSVMAQRTWQDFSQELEIETLTSGNL